MNGKHGAIIAMDAAIIIVQRRVLREIKSKAATHLAQSESRMTWGVGDSEMPRYAPSCHLAEECRSINRL